MTARYPLLLVVAAAMTAGGSARQAPPAEGSVRRVWTAEWTYGLQDPGRPFARFIDWRMAFTGVQEITADGTERWLSREWTWSHRDVYEQHGTIAYDPAVGRYKVDITKTCTGGGTLNLGPIEGASESAGAPRLQAQCEEVSTPVEGTGPGSRRISTEDVNQFPAITPPQEGCTVSESSRHAQGAGVGTSSYSLTVTPFIDTVLDVSTGDDYGGFVPEPGKTLTLTARPSGGRARLRFELDRDGTSHFPGYATNANIDDGLFFEMHGLTHLQEQYANDGPDFLFDAARFDRGAWSRLEPLVVETAGAPDEATFTVTAMDYGAVGNLKAFARSEDCGGIWQPVPLRIGGRDRGAVSLPMDEDGNLMADAYDEYRGDPGRDDEAEPAGNGFAGDGFTAFEEYRGFMAEGGNCDDPRQVWHARTRPDHKNLLVVINANDGGLEPGLRLFEYATKLHVLLVCDQHMIAGSTFGQELTPEPPIEYVNTPRARMVNFTLQEAGVRVWRGKRLSLEPQRGVVIKTFRPGCWEEDCGKQYGHAEPVHELLIGPPRLTVHVSVSSWLEGLEKAFTVVHEMGHAVGIPHHSDDVGPGWELQVGRLNVNGLTSPHQRHSERFPMTAGHIPAVGGLLVDPGETCSAQSGDARYEDGQFVGCFTTRIIRRGQQNSGDFHCPMRYRFGEQSRYEPPGVTARYQATRSVSRSDGGPAVTVDHWSGTLLPYEMPRESITDFRSFCSSTDGTLINEGPDHRNHSGDAGRRKPCSGFIVVNDRAAGTVR